MGKKYQDSTFSATASKRHCIPPSADFLSDVPIIGVIGFPDSAKSNFVHDLVVEIKSRGCSIASIKRIHQDSEYWKNRDSEPYPEDDCGVSMLLTPRGLLLFKPKEFDAPLDEIVNILGDDFDIIIAEGFGHSSIPKILVSDEDLCDLPPEETTNVIAVVSNVQSDIATMRYSFKDIKALADMLETNIINLHSDRTNIYVNNSLVPLLDFPKAIIKQAMIGMLTELKGEKSINNACIRINRTVKWKKRSK